MIRKFFSLPRVLSWVLCFALALISCHVYFHSGVPTTHDGENHLARFANYKIAMKEGQFPPRFAPNLFHRYGYPVFNYNYPLPSILSLPFSLVKAPYDLTFKVIMILAVTLTLIAIWTWLSQVKLKPRARFLAVLSIAASPYLLQTIIYRGSIGEVLALCGMSWWLVWVEAVRETGKERGHTESFKKLLFSTQTVSGGLLLGAFFLSHNVSILFGTPLMLAFSVWWLWYAKTSLVKVVGAFLIGLGLSVWFWIPALAEQSAIVVGGSSLAQQYLQHFPTFSELLNSSFQFGYSFVGSVDSLSFSLGWAQWLAIFCCAGWFLAAAFRKKEARAGLDQTVLVFFVMSILLIIFQLSLSAPIWQLIPLARYIQFPWRLGLFAVVINAALIAWLIQHGIKWQVKLLTLVLILQTIIALRITPVDYLHKSILEEDLFEQSTTTSNENLPKQFTFQEFKDWQPTAVILDGTGTVSVANWTGSRRSYSITAETPVTVVEPTMYFPGWVTTVTSGNSYSLSSYVDNKEIGGRIAYQLPAGKFDVKTEFTQWTPPRIIGNAISIITAIFVLLYFIWYFMRNVPRLVLPHFTSKS